jgi:hypothetical protein
MTLDHFEQSLLTELRGHVAAHAPARSRSRSRSRSRRWRWAALPAGAALAAGGAVVALQPAASAYSVSESGGDVVVTIKRLDDAAGLEKALRSHGIDADVDYSAEPPAPPKDAVVGGNGPQHVESGSGSAERGTTAGPEGPGSGAPAGLADISSSLSKDAFTLRIDTDTLPDDAVVHITTSGSLDGLAGLQVSVAQER